MRLNKLNPIPHYQDGVATIWEITQDETSDYPIDALKKVKDIKFKRLAIFDRTLLDYQARGIDVELKIATHPLNDTSFKSIIVEIDEILYKVENSIQIVSKVGFHETELTLSRSNDDYEKI